MREFGIEDLKEFATDKEHKQHLLQMMDAFDSFCRKNGLRYYLSGGTLLGAIRHKGFIPWDDDVDVNMPRPDCEKLMELSNGKIGDYLLNPPNYTKQYHAYHWKLYDTSILVGKRKRNGLTEKVYPIFIDIFPIEGLPSTKKDTIKHYDKLRKAKEAALFIWDKRPYGGRNPLLQKKRDAEIKALEQKEDKELFDNVVAVQKSIAFDDSDYIGVMSTNVHFEEERVVKSEYTPTIEVEFEGRKYLAPQGYDPYLRQLYGDNYMLWLPIYERVSKHALIPFHSKIKNPDSECLLNWKNWQKTWCPEKPDIKIAICGLVKSENIGELFIARSLEYLIGTECRKSLPDINIEFTEIDLLGRNDHVECVNGNFEKKIVNYEGFKASGYKIDEKLKSLKQSAEEKQSLAARNRIYRQRNSIWNKYPNYRKRLENYFAKRLEGTDFIVIDGAGLLEYSYNEYAWSLLLISEYAEKHGLSVVYNAIGRAGDYDEKDFRCSILHKAIQSDCVKYVSARDSQEIVQRCAGKTHDVKLLADAAFWMKETYGLEAMPNRNKIGIGLIRGNSLLGYGVEFKNEAWVDLFADIAKSLTKRGYEYEFFTNGLPGDIVLARDVLKKLGLPTTSLVVRPIGDVELYKTISQYKALITCRMHSSIAAFTLKIPSVILSWNDKVEKLMKIIGYPERAIPNDSFSPDHIVDCMEKAIDEGVSQEKLNAMKAKALESVDDYIDLILDTVKTKK